MNVLLAFDKFKDSFSAHEACDIVSRELVSLHSDWKIETAPLSDGGDGFCKILTEARQGVLTEEIVNGPLFEKTKALFGVVDLEQLEPELCKWLCVPTEGKISIIEMAQVSGLNLLTQKNRDLWHTSTLGVGELIIKALDLKSKVILLGVGGSATNDLGLGALEALGLRFLNSQGVPIAHLTPASWNQVESITGVIPSELPAIRIACDVTNPLLGPDGAAAIYGPQKGMIPEDWERIEKQSEQMAKMLCRFSGTDKAVIQDKGSGAAGGISFGLRAVTGARLVPGFDLVQQWLQFEEKVAKADMIITGEGRFDRSSLQGKGPGTLIDMAMKEKKEIMVFAGLLSDDLNPHLPPSMNRENLIQITPQNCPLPKALLEGRENLACAIREKVT